MSVHSNVVLDTQNLFCFVYERQAQITQREVVDCIRCVCVVGGGAHVLSCTPFSVVASGGNLASEEWRQFQHIHEDVGASKHGKCWDSLSPIFTAHVHTPRIMYTIVTALFDFPTQPVALLITFYVLVTLWSVRMKDCNAWVVWYLLLALLLTGPV